MLKTRPRIAHLTSVHPRFDTRIFIKMCRSSAESGFDVSLVVADGKGDETQHGVSVFDVGAPRGRLDRILRAPKRVMVKAIELDADIYHLHDPELIPIGLKLKRHGKKVIFDSHEDLAKQLLTKPYLNPIILHILSFAYAVFERMTIHRFDAIIAATPAIRDKFFKLNTNTINVNNFPILGELSVPTNSQERSVVCYIGGISAIRGIRELADALGYVRSEIGLSIAGQFSNNILAKEVRSYPGWSKANEVGIVDRAGVRDLLARSLMGLVTFLPAPNHINAQPNKMFEYMSAGVPVIGSDFPLWREIVEGNECGICVDPTDPKAIASAIDYLAENPKLALKMGQNGHRAVQQKFNWAVEEKKLLEIYSKLLKEQT